MCFVIILTNALACNLSDLYTDEDIKLTIHKNLSEVFELKFKDILEEASIYEPYLYCPALFFKKVIKRLFIEEGFIFVNTIDLDKALNELNYLSIEKFRLVKNQFNKSFKNFRQVRRSINDGRCD